MIDDNKLFRFFAACVTIIVLAVMASCQYKNHLVAETIKDASDPMAAACAWTVKDSALGTGEIVLCQEHVQ